MVKIEEQKTLGPGICLWPFCLPWHKSAILLILYLLKILSSFEMSIVKIKEKITICEPGFGLWPIWTLAASCPQSPVKDTGEMNSRRRTCYVSLACHAKKYLTCVTFVALCCKICLVALYIFKTKTLNSKMCICKKERQFSDMLSTDPNFISTFTSFTEKDLLQNFSFPSIFKYCMWSWDDPVLMGCILSLEQVWQLS